MAVTTSYTWVGVTGGAYNGFNNGSPYGPAAARFPSGHWYGAWVEPSATNIAARRLTAGLTFTTPGDSVVNTTTSGFQLDPDVAVTTGGGVAFVFTDESSGVFGDIRLRYINTAGNPLAEVLVANDAQHEYGAAVTALADGGFAVTWTRVFGATDRDVGVKVYNADGTLRGGPSYAEAGVADARESAIAGLADGRIAVAWTESSGGSSSTAIKLCFFTAQGAIDGTVLTLDSTGTINQEVAILALPDGGFVVAYADNGWGFGSTEITARVYNANGTTRSSFLQVNLDTAGAQTKPSLALISDGVWAVTWLNAGVAEAQAFSSAGARLGPTWSVGQASAIDIAGGSGRMIALRESTTFDGDGGSIQYGLYDFVRTSTGDAASDTITGDGLIDVMNGGAGADTLSGLGGNDDLRGDDGDDLLSGGAGDDILTGGLGADTALYSGLRAAYSMNTAGAVTTIVGEGTDSIVGVERFQFADQLIVFTDVGLTIYGDATANTLTAGTGKDVVYGGAQNDTIFGFGDNDLLIGELGDDILIGGDGDDALGGGDGVDWMEGGAGVDWLSGGDGNDRLEGGSGLDTLDGQGGIDAMFGGAGDDIYYVDDFYDDVFEVAGEGSDTVYSSVNWGIRANVENLTLTGVAAINAYGDNANNILVGNDAANLIGGFDGADWIEGRGGIDWMSGGTGADRLDGGDGADVLQGQSGADYLIGGAGADIFIYDGAGDSNAAGYDTIADFQTGVDKLHLAAVRASAGDAFTILGASGNSYVLVDIGGDGFNDMVIELLGVTNLAASDVIWGSAPAAASLAGKGSAPETSPMEAEVVEVRPPGDPDFHSPWTIETAPQAHWIY